MSIILFSLAVTALVVLVVFMAAQTVLVVGFWFRMSQTEQAKSQLEVEPPVGVVLCLRGADPYLEKCLQAIYQLNYSNFELLIVLDHPEDPAREAVDRVVAENSAKQTTVATLKEKRPECSLKCSSLVQAVETLQSRCEIIAQLDADTVVHPNWLTELAHALDDPKVAVATGNRWYAPGNRSLGSLVRYVWNAGAIVQMYWYRIPWGGTLAVKTSLFRETNVLKKWKTAFCEDTMLFEVCRLAGYRVAFVNSLLMVNREDCQVGDFTRWASRQLLTAKLYHPAWLAVTVHGLITTWLPTICFFMAILCAAIGESTAAWVFGLTAVGCQLVNMVLVLLIELGARAAISQREDANYKTDIITLLGAWLLLPLTQVVYGFATITSMLTKQVAWRGVEYQIREPFDISMVEYRRYAEPNTNVEKASL